MTIDREAMREKVARAIARANGDEFANAFKNKDRWNAKRGMSGGRFRDINEPFQSDYLAMADAALSAIDQPAQEPFGYYVEHALADPWFTRPPNYVPHSMPNYRVTPLYRARPEPDRSRGCDNRRCCV